MTGKLIFFDIDGTLKPFGKPVPPDTADAIRQLKKNGHLPVICTGRTRLMMRHARVAEELGFPAMICAAGSEVLYQGETVSQQLLSRETIEWTLKLLEPLGCGAILEGPEHLYCEERWMEPIRRRWNAVMGGESLILPYDPETARIQKLMTMNSPALAGSPQLEELSKVYNVLFYDDGDTTELIPLSVSKAVGIERLLEHLGASREDTYAFGDGPNDLEMLEYVAHGVAMGNAERIVKERARYVTEGCEEGGIAKALRRFGLI